MNWLINQVINLQNGADAPRVWPNVLMMHADDMAHKWQVWVADGRTPVDMTGWLVTGYFVRADGYTVPVGGTVSGNVATVVLPQACYAVEGELTGILRAAKDGVVITLSALIFRVRKDLSDSYIDPDHKIPTLDELLAKIADMEAATLAGIEAADNANTAAQDAITATQDALGAAQDATDAAQGATLAAQAAQSVANQWGTVDVEAVTLPPEMPAEGSITQSETSTTIHLGIPQGEQGAPGTGLHVLGTFPTLGDLLAAHPVGQPGDAYTVGNQDGTYIWIWDSLTQQWINNGPTGGANLPINGVMPGADGYEIHAGDIPTNVPSQNVQEALDGKLPLQYVINNLETTNPGYALDARQGMALHTEIGEVRNRTGADMQVGPDDPLSIQQAIGLAKTTTVSSDPPPISADSHSPGDRYLQTPPNLFFENMYPVDRTADMLNEWATTAASGVQFLPVTDPAQGDYSVLIKFTDVNTFIIYYKTPFLYDPNKSYVVCVTAFMNTSGGNSFTTRLLNMNGLPYTLYTSPIQSIQGNKYTHSVIVIPPNATSYSGPVYLAFSLTGASNREILLSNIAFVDTDATLGMGFSLSTPDAVRIFEGDSWNGGSPARRQLEFEEWAVPPWLYTYYIHAQEASWLSLVSRNQYRTYDISSLMTGMTFNAVNGHKALITVFGEYCYFEMYGIKTAATTAGSTFSLLTNADTAVSKIPIPRVPASLPCFTPAVAASNSFVRIVPANNNILSITLNSIAAIAANAVISCSGFYRVGIFL